MLRKIRIGISVVLFALITFYFLDFANILPNSFHRLAHIQFVPAVLSLSIGILIVLIASTLLFGRIYCSTICPMGIWQDVIAHISKSVDNLRAKGFVVLTEDENDRRKRHIELTEKAVEAAKNMLEVHNECKEVVMRYVTDEEKELMNQIMQKMLRSLDEELQK